MSKEGQYQDFCLHGHPAYLSIRENGHYRVLKSFKNFKPLVLVLRMAGVSPIELDTKSSTKQKGSEKSISAHVLIYLFEKEIIYL